MTSTGNKKQQEAVHGRKLLKVSSFRLTQNQTVLVVWRRTTTLKPLSSLQLLTLGRSPKPRKLQRLLPHIKREMKRSSMMASWNVYYAELALSEKGNPNRSIEEEPRIQINALNEVPELKSLFEGYNMYWMAKTLRKYNMEMVREFYANYYYTMEKGPLKECN
ncbi:hypothetical protein HAX54_011447 [Datura stramonium]|uniref:Uncharacterized protein n=1 Tax=Datura stramonium TaxID=4076 RepID=A0ABS8TJR7_DATST|nr:hypothetical protein [Datura stramonium]